MNPQVLPTITSACRASATSSWPARRRWPSITSLSTRFLGQPRLTRPTRSGEDSGPAAARRASSRTGTQPSATRSLIAASVRLVGGVDRVAPLPQLVAVAGGVELVADVGHLLAHAPQDALVLLVVLGQQREVVRDRVEARDGLVDGHQQALHQLHQGLAAEAVVPGRFHGTPMIPSPGSSQRSGFTKESRMKKLGLSLAALLAAASFGWAQAAAQAPAEKPAAAPSAAPAKTKTHKVDAEVVSVDVEKKTITVKAEGE